MGLFGDTDTVFRFSRLRVVYVGVFVCSLALTELGRFIYRPFVDRVGVSDFGIADTMGNSLGTVTQIFFILVIVHANWRQGLRVIVFVVCGYILYEFLQPMLPRGTFDTKDLVATLVGGVVAAGILWLAKELAGDRVISDT